jgi:hypothetical protein
VNQLLGFFGRTKLVDVTSLSVLGARTFHLVSFKFEMFFFSDASPFPQLAERRED